MQTRSSPTPTLCPPRLGRPATRTRLAALGAAALLPLYASAAPQPPTATELMDWAQAKLSSFFPGQLTDVSGEGFVFRGPYSTGNFIGVSAGTVYAMGPATEGQLLALGTLQELACVVKPASCGPSDAQALLDDYLARWTALYAGEVTAGSAFAPFLDGCFMHSGRNRALEIGRFDTDPAVRASANRKRGSTRRNAEVLAERFRINPDGSDRREMDVRYDIVYTDGTVETTRETVIQGSSAGVRTPLGVCGTPQASQQLRSFGNRRIVGTSVSALTILQDRYRLSDGAPQANGPRLYRNEIRFNVSDPGNVATYATISGPGIVGSAYKLISPRLLRSAPEFAGKVGNFVDWEDADTFKACRNANDNNYADAALANCVVNGAVGNNWRAQGIDPAQVDAAFAGYGFAAGGEYTIKVYADDGWKTVNGQAVRTPIATYTTRLAKLPSSAAAMAAGTAGRYGISTLSKTPGELAALTRSRSSDTLQFTEATKAQVDGHALPWVSVYFFAQGRTAASTSNNYYPASRYNPATVPASGANKAVLPIPAAPAAMTQATYGEFGSTWGDLSGFSVRHMVTFD